MFAEVKSMLPVCGDEYDAEIIMQIKAAALDLTRTAEIIMPGEISISRTADTWDEDTGEATHWTITDESTVTDELIITAISVWCQMRIGNPPNYAQLLDAYREMKGSMRISGSYTCYGEREEEQTDEADDQLCADRI